MAIETDREYLERLERRMAQREWHFKLEGYIQASTKQEAWERANVIAAQAGYPLVVYSVSINSVAGPAAGAGVEGGQDGNTMREL